MLPLRAVTWCYTNDLSGCFFFVSERGFSGPLLHVPLLCLIRRAKFVLLLLCFLLFVISTIIRMLRRRSFHTISIIYVTFLSVFGFSDQKGFSLYSTFSRPSKKRSEMQYLLVIMVISNQKFIIYAIFSIDGLKHFQFSWPPRQRLNWTNQRTRATRQHSWNIRIDLIG